VRRELADSRRKTWDDVQRGGGSSSGPDTTLVEQVRLLMSFFIFRRRDDIERLTVLSQDIYHAGYGLFLGRQDVQLQGARLATVTLEALHS